MPMKRTLTLVAWIASFLLAQAADAGTLNLKISGFESDQGRALVVIFDKAEGFPLDHSKAWKRLKTKIVDRKGTLQVDGVPAGGYAAVVIHDVNGNNKLDRSFAGFPKEDLGLSNYAKFGRPKFEKARFQVEAEKTVEIAVKIFKRRR